MGPAADDCGCCAGTGVETPAAKSNPPGLPAIAYRIGTQPGFRASLLARLSGTDFPALRALSTRNDEPEKASRPFDKDRDGFVVGEGAGVLILEEYEFAKRRGAKIFAEEATLRFLSGSYSGRLVIQDKPF